MSELINEKNENVTAEEKKSVEIIGINFREAGKIYYFAPGKFKLNLGEKVIVETARGVEIGTVKTPNKLVPESEIVTPLKEITRPATKDDLLKDEKNKQAEFDAAVICKKKIQNHYSQEEYSRCTSMKEARQCRSLTSQSQSSWNQIHCQPQ